MDVSRLYRIAEAKDTERTDLFGLRSVIDRYPYFQAGIFAYLDCLYRYDNGKFKDELSRLSILVNDRRALFYYILRDDYKYFLQKTGKKELKEDKTNVLLNAFFESQGLTGEDGSLEYEMLSANLASVDYFLYLENIDNAVNDQKEVSVPFKHQDIIDSYIEKVEKEGNTRIDLDSDTELDASGYSFFDEAEEELTDEMFFTETLAKIYVKQKKYEKAYKIIKHLSLNYPKKNIYFADQLSFLEKLIINSKYKDKK